MPIICYVPRRFRAASLATIETANDICAEYAALGFDLTLRQLYYQFVARDFIANNQQEYNKLGTLIDAARLAGVLDWDYIVDRTRHVRSLGHWETPNDIVSEAAAVYHLDKWADQPTRVEVWIEKDALVNVIAKACTRNDVAYFSCRGYTSQSEMWRASQRLLGYIREGQDVVILHLGDHDPSGIDMTRDIRDRLSRFVAHHDDADMLNVTRIALNRDQVDQYRPPENTAKVDDSRYTDYLEEYGPKCWELDALSPTVLDALVEAWITFYRGDEDAWQAMTAREQVEKSSLEVAARRWQAVAAKHFAAAQLKPRGRPTLTAGKGDNDNVSSSPRQRGTSAVYLRARLERDYPTIAADLDAGVYRSVRAAAMAAGIVGKQP